MQVNLKINHLKRTFILITYHLKSLTSINGGFVDISDGGRFNDVSDHKLFDSLVFWDTSGTIGAPYSFNVTTAVFSASSITAFASLK